jgi:hypothetical protein
MNCIEILYLTVLFIVCSPGILIPKMYYKSVKNILLITILHGVLFIGLFRMTYPIVRSNTTIVENLEVTGNTDSLVNIFNTIIDGLKSKPTKKYTINTELIQVTPDVAEKYTFTEEKIGNKVLVLPNN